MGREEQEESTGGLLESLRAFFKPEAIAIVGATKGVGFGSGLPRCLIENGYRERLRLVNPREKEIAGLEVFPNVCAIPGTVDLAIVIVPSRACTEVMRDCARKGVKAVIVEAAGFSETGPEGKQREREMISVAREAGIRVIGPNCIGVVNTSNRFVATQVRPESLTPGRIAVIAQSGVFGNIVLDWGPENGVSFSKVITIGNRSDVGELELMEYLSADPDTRVIVLYLESVQDGRAFLSAARRVSREKPVLVLKSGRSEAGQQAAQSHTGSLAGNDTIYEAAFRQAGVIRSDNFFMLFDLARAFALQPLPRGRGVGIITSSGSLGVQTADACVNLGVRIPDLTESSRKKMREQAPAWMSVRNPLDVGPSGLFSEGLSALLTDPEIDGVIGIPVLPSFVAREFIDSGIPPGELLGPLPRDLIRTCGKPLLLAPVGNRKWMEILRAAFGDEIPLISSPEGAAHAFQAMARYQEYVVKSRGASAQ